MSLQRPVSCSVSHAIVRHGTRNALNLLHTNALRGEPCMCVRVRHETRRIAGRPIHRWSQLDEPEPTPNIQIRSILSVLPRRNSSHSLRPNTLVVVPTARTQLAPRALAQSRHSSSSKL